MSDTDPRPGDQKRRALVIAHEPDGHAGLIEQRLIERGIQVDTHIVTHDYDRPSDAEPWPTIEDYDLVLPMGSVRSLTRKDEIETWVHDELDLLRDAHESNVPMLGVCFGGQLLADALGGSVETAPDTELGWYEIEGPTGVENPAGPGPWKEWHHDRFTPPAHAQVLATNENAVQLFRIGSTVGTQFHPEVDVEHLANWLTQADDEYLAECNTDRATIMAEASDHEARNREQCNAFVDWFLDEVAFPATNSTSTTESATHQ